jgi:hypothetical protein
MKKILGIILFWLSISTAFAAYQQQWFSSFQENINGPVNMVCQGQCVAIIGDTDQYDTLRLEWSLSGQGILGYWFLVGQQVVPANTTQVNGNGPLDQQFVFTDSPVFGQIPAGSQIVFILQGNFEGQLNFSPEVLGFGEKIVRGFKEALQYREFNPRTINFLEGPTWNWQYINQHFFRWIILLLFVAIIRHFFSSQKKDKAKAVYFGVGVLVFFRVFFDFFSTVNQVKIYNQIMSVTNIMENGRVGRSSDFYQFLDFIKTKVPNKEKWFFIAPYPFDFEGKYHIYPNVKFGSITGVNYLFFYNPYGGNNPFNFVDPTYSWGILTWNKLTFKVQQEITRKPYAKIYILKK